MYFANIRIISFQIRGFFFEDKLAVRSNVHFSDHVVLPNEARLRLISFTLEATCELENNGQRGSHVLFVTTANVVLHVTRGKIHSISQCLPSDYINNHETSCTGCQVH